MCYIIRLLGISKGTQTDSVDLELSVKKPKMEGYSSRAATHPVYEPNRGMFE